LKFVVAFRWVFLLHSTIFHLKNWSISNKKNCFIPTLYFVGFNSYIGTLYI
jgi:hypothetical protein